MTVDAGLAAALDATLLRPDADDRDVSELARFARGSGCAAVCVAPRRAATVVRALRGSPTRCAVVVSFPSGFGTPAMKQFEALEGVRLGAHELDVVCDLDAVRRGDVAALEREMVAIMECTPEAAHKFIVEVDWLPAPAWKHLGRALCRVRPAFVKTGTGVHGGPVRVEQVCRLLEVTRGEVAVKAAGGIRTRDAARELLAAGAARLGTSSAAAILAETGPES